MRLPCSEIDEIVMLSDRSLQEGVPRRHMIKTVVAKRCEEAGRLPQRILDYL
jgi:hypothetical protein